METGGSGKDPGAAPTGRAGESVNLELTFELAGGPYAVTASRLALAEIDNHLEPSVAFDVRLLVSELVTNSVEHAAAGPEDSIALALTITNSCVHVAVRDEGPGFTPPTAAPPHEGDKGWGLFLVEQLADKWGVSDTDGSVWFEISSARDVPNEGAAA